MQDTKGYKNEVFSGLVNLCWKYFTHAQNQILEKMYHVGPSGKLNTFWNLFTNSMHARMLRCLSHVRLFATPRAVACQASLSMELLQPRLLAWVAMPYSKGSSWPRDWFCISCCLPHWQAGSSPLASPGKLIQCLFPFYSKANRWSLAWNEVDHGCSTLCKIQATSFWLIHN